MVRCQRGVKTTWFKRCESVITVRSTFPVRLRVHAQFRCASRTLSFGSRGHSARWTPCTVEPGQCRGEAGNSDSSMESGRKNLGKGKGKRRNKSDSLRCSGASDTRFFRVGSPLTNGAKLSFDDDGGARTAGHWFRLRGNVAHLGKTRDQSTSFRAGKVIFEVNEYEAYEAQRWLVGDVQ